MNRFFYPQARDPKLGLRKNRKIVQYESGAPAGDLRSSIPGNWYYNDANAEKVWEEIENDAAKKELNPMQQERSTFQKIDESTHRIRQMIANFEVNDQQFLAGLMDLLDEEQIHMSEETDILLEARFRLSQLIETHAGNAAAQGKMLDSVKEWFNGAIQHSQDSVADGVGDWVDRTASFDVTSLANMINQSFEIREMSTEQIEELHRCVVDQLTRKIRDMRRQIDKQKEKIETLEQALESNTSRRKRQAAMTRDSEQMLSSARRTIVEQEGRIINLKQAINDLKNEVRAPESSRPQASPAQAGPEDDSRMLRDLEKDLTFDRKIKQLTDTVSSLKLELNEDLHTIRKMKQNEVTLENRIQALERAKKGAEQSLSAANEKLKAAEAEYQRRLESATKVETERAVTEAVTQTKLLYEKQLQDLREENRQRVNDMAEKTEKRYKGQMAKLVQAIEDKDKQAALKEINNQGAVEVENVKQQWAAEVKDLKQSYEHKISVITRHYEDKNKTLLEDRRQLEERTKDDLKQMVENEKMKMDEECCKRLLEYQDKSASDLGDVRTKFLTKLDKLDTKIKLLEKEKLAMESIIRENELQDELPEVHEVEEDEPEDDVLNESLIELKQRETEKKVSVKFNALLKAQRGLLEEEKQWEMEILAKNLKYDANEVIANLRSEIMTRICNFREAMVSDSSALSEALDQVMLDILGLVEKHDSEINSENAKLETMPVVEVQSRIANLKDKITDLTGENEFLRLTLAELNNGEDLKRGDNHEDIIRAMRTALAEQARKMTDTLKEYEEMKQKLQQIELKSAEAGPTDVSVQVTPEPVLYQMCSSTIFGYVHTPIGNVGDQDNLQEPEKMNDTKATKETKSLGVQTEEIPTAEKLEGRQDRQQETIERSQTPEASEITVRMSRYHTSGKR